MKQKMTTRLFSVLLTVCMLVALLPVGGVFTASAADTPLSFEVLANWSDYAAANGITAVSGSNIANAAKIKDYRTAATYGWSAGTLVSSANANSDWIWTQSATTLGLYFEGSAAEETYNSIAIDIKTAGIYQMDTTMTRWANGGNLDVYLVHSVAGQTIDKIRAGAYIAKVEGFDTYLYPNSSQVQGDCSATIPYVQLETGTYQVVFDQRNYSGTGTPGYFLKSINFTETTEITGVTISGNSDAKLLVGATRQLSATVAPTGAAQNITWISSDPYVASVDQNGLVTAVGIGTTTITAQSAKSSVSDSVTISTGVDNGAISYFDTMTRILGSTVNKNVKDYSTSTWSDKWQAGSLLSAGTGDWVWSSSSRSLGIYFAAGGADAYNSIDILVSESGYYKLHSHHTPWASGGTIKMYLAEAGQTYENMLANAIVESDPIDHYAPLPSDSIYRDVEVDVADYVKLEGGKTYTILYQQVGGSSSNGYFIKGVHLERYPDVTGVDFAWDSLTLALDETRTLISAVHPTGVLQDVTYETADDSIVEINGDQITGLKQGTTTITVYSVADPTKYQTIDVTVSAATVSYDYRTEKGNATLDMNGWEINNEAHSENAALEWIETSALSHAYGLFFGNAFGMDTETGDYVSVNVRVPTGGVYQVATEYLKWQKGGLLDVYLVETEDADDYLTKGTKLNLDAIDTQYDVNDKSKVALVQDSHEVEVELSADKDYTIVYHATSITDRQGNRQGFYLSGTRLTAVDFGFEFYRYAPGSVSDAGEDVLAESLWSAQYRHVMTNGFYWKWTPSSVYGGIYTGSLFGALNEKYAETASYIGVNIEIPASGEYEVLVDYMPYNGAGTANFYLMSYEDSLVADYFPSRAVKLNNEPIDMHNETAITEGQVVTLDNHYTFAEPGKYTFVVEFTGETKGIYLRGVDFNAMLYVDEINIDEEETIILKDDVETYEISYEVIPSVGNTDLNWISSDESVATVENGTVTFLKNGHAAITAQATDGSGFEKVIHFLRGYDVTYDYKFRESVKLVYDQFDNSPNIYIPAISGTDETLAAAANAFVDSYDAAIAAGSAPWMYETTEGAKELLYTASSDQGFGLFVNYGNPGDIARLRLDVSENGRYHMVFNYDRWKAAGAAFDLYLAPIEASDPCADKWLIHSNTDLPNTEELRNEVYVGKRDLPSGEYYLTLKFREETANKLIGFSNFKLLKYEELGMYTIEGAQIRTTGTQGIRFISWISKDVYPVDSATVKEFGTVLIPTASLDDGDINNLVIGKKMSDGQTVAKVQAFNRFEDEPKYVLFTAVITQLPTSKYNMSISARAYVIYEDENGMEHTIYGDTYTERSIYEVAKNGLEKTDKEGEKVVFQEIVDAVEQAQ